MVDDDKYVVRHKSPGFLDWVFRTDPKEDEIVSSSGDVVATIGPKAIGLIDSFLDTSEREQEVRELSGRVIATIRPERPTLLESISRTAEPGKVIIGQDNQLIGTIRDRKSTLLEALSRTGQHEREIIDPQGRVICRIIPKPQGIIDSIAGYSQREWELRIIHSSGKRHERDILAAGSSVVSSVGTTNSWSSCHLQHRKPRSGACVGIGIGFLLLATYLILLSLGNPYVIAPGTIPAGTIDHIRAASFGISACVIGLGMIIWGFLPGSQRAGSIFFAGIFILGVMVTFCILGWADIQFNPEARDPRALIGASIIAALGFSTSVVMLRAAIRRL